MRRTLILNSGYMPLNAISWQRAVCLLYRGKAELLEKYCDWQLHSAHDVHPAPAVLRLVEYNRPPQPHTKFCRENVFLRDDYTCQYCLKEKNPRNLTFDHVVPRRRGGKTSWTNIVTACRPCNHLKADRTPKEAGMKLLNEPTMPNPYKISRKLIAAKKEVPDEWNAWLL